MSTIHNLCSRYKNSAGTKLVMYPSKWLNNWSMLVDSLCAVLFRKEKKFVPWEWVSWCFNLRHALLNVRDFLKKKSSRQGFFLKRAIKPKKPTTEKQPESGQKLEKRENKTAENQKKKMVPSSFWLDRC